MPNIESAYKRVRQDEKRTAKNKSEMSRLRTAVKKYKTAVDNNEDSSDALLREAVKLIDKSASNNLIHQNKANRMKSNVTTYAAKQD